MPGLSSAVYLAHLTMAKNFPLSVRIGPLRLQKHAVNTWIAVIAILLKCFIDCYNAFPTATLTLSQRLHVANFSIDFQQVHDSPL